MKLNMQDTRSVQFKSSMPKSSNISRIVNPIRHHQTTSQFCAWWTQWRPRCWHLAIIALPISYSSNSSCAQNQGISLVDLQQNENVSPFPILDCRNPHEKCVSLKRWHPQFRWFTNAIHTKMIEIDQFGGSSLSTKIKMNKIGHLGHLSDKPKCHVVASVHPILSHYIRHYTPLFPTLYPAISHNPHCKSHILSHLISHIICHYIPIYIIYIYISQSYHHEAPEITCPGCTSRFCRKARVLSLRSLSRCLLRHIVGGWKPWVPTKTCCYCQGPY